MVQPLNLKLTGTVTVRKPCGGFGSGNERRTILTAASSSTFLPLDSATTSCVTSPSGDRSIRTIVTPCQFFILALRGYSKFCITAVLTECP